MAPLYAALAVWFLSWSYNKHSIEKFPERRLQPDDVMPPPVLL